MTKLRTFHADLGKLPAALVPLTSQRRWVIWKWQKRKGRDAPVSVADWRSNTTENWTKPPFQPRFYNEPAKSDDPSTWGTYADAVLAVTQGHADGIGLMLKGSGLAAIDLDHIRDFATGRVLKWAEELFAEAAAVGHYIEWTVSGTGARIIGIAAGSKLHKKITVHKKNGCACEFYRDCERFITVSGFQISGDYPSLPVTDKLNDFDTLFDTIYARFADAKLRPAASDCVFAPGLVIGVEEIEPEEPAGLLDFNDAGPQVDYNDLIANGAPQGERSEAFQRVVWHLAAQGKSAEEIAEQLGKHPNGIAEKYAGRLLQEVQRSFGKWQQHRLASVTGAAAGTNANATTLWPTILIKQGEIPRVVNEAETALLQLNHEIYQRAGRLVEPQLIAIKGCGGREFLSWRLPEVTAMNLVEEFSCAARFMKYDKRSNKWLQTDVPLNVAQAYLDRKVKRVPQVVGIANAPFLRADGTVCDREGYDQATRVLCKWNGQSFPPVPLDPTRDDALAALAILEQPIAEFPFETPADKSGMLSAILTALDRKGMDIAPLHAFTTPEGGTGKGLLMDIIAVIVTGWPMPADNQGHTEEESEKRLGASLIEGDSLIGIDNCERPLEGAFLNSIVTQHTVRVRILGKSKKVQCPNYVALFANGNNLVVGSTMTRRVIRCAMNAKTERPETRKFKDNRLLETVRLNRVKLAIAGLTLLRAWHIARPKANINVSSLDFVEWTERVRKALVWLDRIDPGATVEKVREDDPHRIKCAVVFAEWHRVLGEDRVQTKTVIERAINDQDFYAALMAVADGYKGTISPERLGRWLGQNKDRIAGSLSLRRAGFSPRGTPLWQVRKI